jgi:hypothetical protein
MAYPWPSINGNVFVKNSELDVTQEGLLQDVPSNAPVRLSVRVYVVGSFRLRTNDVNGTSDPYLVVKLGCHTNIRRRNSLTAESSVRQLLSRSTPRFEVRNVAYRTAYLYKITNKLDAAWLNMHIWIEGPKFDIRRGQEIFPSATPICVIWALLVSSG